MIPAEHKIEAVMAETGMGRMQAINHLRQRDHAERAYRTRIRRLANAEWNAIASEVDPKTHAARHLAEMPAVRRDALNAEWN